MKIATWNVNSIRARLPRVLAWLEAARPDVALLQETKVTDEQFPAEPFEDLGYNLAAGRRAGGRNGVAILAKSPIEDLRHALPGDAEDQEARYIEAVVRGVRVASVYVPNGTALGSPRFAFKLAFFDRLKTHAEELLKHEETLVIGGDYNVGPYPIDVFDPAALDGTICYHPAERAKLRALLHLGLYDAYRIVEPRSPGLQLVGLSGPLLPRQPGAPDRPSAALAAGGRPARDLRDRRRASAPPRRRPTTCRCGARSAIDPRNKRYRKALARSIMR